MGTVNRYQLTIPVEWNMGDEVLSVKIQYATVSSWWSLLTTSSPFSISNQTVIRSPSHNACWDDDASRRSSS